MFRFLIKLILLTNWSPFCTCIIWLESLGMGYFWWEGDGKGKDEVLGGIRKFGFIWFSLIIHFHQKVKIGYLYYCDRSPSTVGNRGTEQLNNLPSMSPCLLPAVGPSPPSGRGEGGASQMLCFLYVAGWVQGSVTRGWRAVFPLSLTGPSGRPSLAHRFLVPPAMQRWSYHLPTYATTIILTLLWIKMSTPL